MTVNKIVPPLVSGAVLGLGHSLEFNKQRDVLLKRGYQEHGSIFTIDLALSKGVVLIGPEYQQQFFELTDKQLDTEKAYEFLKALFGEVGFTASVETYINQRPVLYEPFSRKKMLGYIEVMQQVIQTWLDGLADEGEMELNAEMVHVTQQVAGQSFLGKDFHEKVGEEFWAHYETLGKALDPLLPPNLPLPKFIKRDIAKKEMRAILNPIIAERRKNVGKGVYNDFLQDFVEKKMADGTLLDDDTVLGMIIAIMFAGHETTAGQAAWSVIQLLQHPDYLELLQEEIDSKLPHNTVINFETLASLEHVLWAVEETARMKPSADVLFRVVKEEIEIGGYTIPKKWVVVVSADVAHNLPELFENPEKYEPLRFGPERNEKKQHRYALIGFGGGTHKCAGINFAYNEMIMVTALLFQQFELELLTKKPFVDRGLGASKPSVTHIRYKRKPIKTVIDEEIIKQTLAVGCPHLAKQQ